MQLIEIKKRLDELSTSKIKGFSSKLIPNALPILGCKIPDVRKLAKEICKEDIHPFLKEYDASSYELQLCYAYVIASAKIPLEERFVLINDFVKTIKDWAVCDGLVSSLKCVKKNLEEWLNFLKQYKNSKKEFEVRFLAEMLMSYYINDSYVHLACDMIKDLDISEYYAKMGVAWFIATLMISYSDEAFHLLEIIEDPLTISMTIRKIRDSYRISDEIKEQVLTYKK